MRTFFPDFSERRLAEMLHWSRLKKAEMSQAILITKDSVLGFLRRQIEKGNWEAVQEVLKGKPMTKAGKFMFSQLRDHVASNLIMRLGLRKVIAVGIAIVLLPLILAKFSGEMINMFRKKEV